MTAKERADAVYACFCGWLDGQGYRYGRDDGERSLALKLAGKEFPVALQLHVDEENERTFVFCKLPFDLRKEKEVDLVMATTYVNQVMDAGAFCVNAEGGYCSWEKNELFAGLSEFTRPYAERVVVSAFSAVEQYGDKLFAVNKGLLTVKELAATL